MRGIMGEEGGFEGSYTHGANPAYDVCMGPSAALARSVGAVALCWLAEHTKDNMLLTAAVRWDSRDPVGSWDRHVANRQPLRQCLEERK